MSNKIEVEGVVSAPFKGAPKCTGDCPFYLWIGTGFAKQPKDPNRRRVLLKHENMILPSLLKPFLGKRVRVSIEVLN